MNKRTVFAIGVVTGLLITVHALANSARKGNLIIINPKTGQRIGGEAKLPPELQQILDDARIQARVWLAGRPDFTA